MTNRETIAIARAEYDALLDRNGELEDKLAALDAKDSSRIPHEVALAIIRGKSPILALREHQGITLRELSQRAGTSASYLSEIERGHKTGSASALSRIAGALGTTIDLLIGE